MGVPSVEIDSMPIIFLENLHVPLAWRLDTLKKNFLKVSQESRGIQLLDIDLLVSAVAEDHMAVILMWRTEEERG